MRQLTRPLVAAVLVVLVAPSRADAWGFEAHKYIMSRAIALLPAQIRPLFEAERVSVVERAVDPDLWRTAGWPGESERHFVDLDAYGAHPFKELPRDLEEAIKKYGREFVEKNGIVLGCTVLGLAATAAAALSPGYWWFVALFALGRPLLASTGKSPA